MGSVGAQDILAGMIFSAGLTLRSIHLLIFLHPLHGLDQTS